MSYQIEGFTPQGWQCPVCGAVYSPMTMACMNCTGWKISNKDSTTTGGADIDTLRKYLNHSIFKPVDEEQDGLKHYADGSTEP